MPGFYSKNSWDDSCLGSWILFYSHKISWISGNGQKWDRLAFHLMSWVQSSSTSSGGHFPTFLPINPGSQLLLLPCYYWDKVNEARKCASWWKLRTARRKSPSVKYLAMNNCMELDVCFRFISWLPNSSLFSLWTDIIY